MRKATTFRGKKGKKGNAEGEAASSGHCEAHEADAFPGSSCCTPDEPVLGPDKDGLRTKRVPRRAEALSWRATLDAPALFYGARVLCV